MLLFGVNLWGMTAVWPLLAARALSVADLALALACLAPLLTGAAPQTALGARPRLADALAGVLWLVVYPAALVAGLAARPEAENQLHHAPFALLLSWLSLCAYGASAAGSCAPQPAQHAAVHNALGDEPWDAPEADRRRLQRLVIALCTCGAAAIAVLAPALGGFADLEQSWGDAALAGGVLTAVVGAALGVAVLGVFLGNGLRADKAEAPPRTEPALRAAWFLLLALLGAVTYLVVQP